MDKQLDLAIIGAGPVGSLLALALQGAGLNLAVFEASPQAKDRASYDGRTLALSYASRVFLESLGFWSAIAKTAEPIAQVHVSQQGHLGNTRLSSESVNAPALGYVIPARQLGEQIDAALIIQAVPVFYQHRLAAVESVETIPQLRFETPEGSQVYSAKQVIGADGAQSTLRHLLALNQGEKDYGQTAVLAKLTLSQPHEGVAYERFTTQGPIALLPLPNQQASLVWTHPHAQVSEILNLSDDAFLAQVQAAFGYRAGVFSQVTHRFAYPLKLVHSPVILKGRGLLIGNAAHALHPVSGQGLNLGIEDVARLVDFFAAYPSETARLQALPAFANQLQAHHQKLVRSTDGLVRVFGVEGAWAGHLRGLGLMALEALSPLKSRFTKQAMGLVRPLARMKQGDWPFAQKKMQRGMKP